MGKRRLGPSTNLYPMPALLVAVKTGEGKTNIVTVAWAGVVGGDPPLIALDIATSHYSTPFIERERCFTVNVPRASQAAEADYCGIVSGRKDPDKSGTCGFTLEPATQVSAPLISECPLSFECRLRTRVETGSGSFLLAEILETHADEAALDANGAIDSAKLDPLIFTPDGQYYRLGERVAKAFSVGKKLRKKERP